MNNLFMELPTLGQLYFHHTYLFYDEPLLFSCVSKTFQYYFVIAIPSNTETDSSWIIVPVSPGRLNKAEKNSIEIRELILEPEANVFKVVQKADSKSETEITPISPKEITEEYLPQKGTLLDYSPSLELSVPTSPSLDQAKKEMRDIIEISLEKDNSHISELPCTAAAETLSNLQQLVYALAYKGGSLRGTIPQRIKDACSLSLSGMYAASVGFRLKSDELCDLFFETSLTPTIQDLNYLLSISSDKEQLKRFFETHGHRVASKFRTFLGSLVRNKVAFMYNGASPNDTCYSRHFSTQDISKSLALVAAEVEEIVETETFYGQLVGINVNNNTFELLTTEKDRIRGTISSGICGQQFSVPNTVEAIIEMRVGQDSMTGEEKIIYTLIQLNEIVSA